MHSPNKYREAAARVREMSDEQLDQELDALLSSTPSAAQTITLSRFSEVRPSTIRWLWKQRIPFGKPAMLEGDPGLGKSLVSVDVAARYTTGRAMPLEDCAEYGEPGGVVFLASEDGLEDTIVPRFLAAGGDPKRAARLSLVLDGKSGLMRTPTVGDLAAWEEAAQDMQAGLFVIDPLTGHLPQAVNSWRDEQMRAVLTPLADFAERLGIAVLPIRHYTKDADRSALYRGTGSIAITALARSVMSVLVDPTRADLDNRYILAPVKLNGARKPRCLAYEIVGDTISPHPRVRWIGPMQQSTDELLRLAQRTQQADSQLAKAMRELRDFLLAKPGSTRDDITAALGPQGIAWRTIERAAAEYGELVSSRPQPEPDGRKVWRWYFVVP